MKYFVILLVLIGYSLTFTQAFAQSDSTVAEFYWKEAAFPSHDRTKATVIVNDPDMNRHPNVIDYVWLEIHSDSDHIGFKIPIFETDFDSGIFKGYVVFVGTSPSGRGFLHTVDGDTITAKYIDNNFPSDYVSELGNIIVTEDKIEMFATAIVGGSSPPLERIHASNFKLLDLRNIPITDNLISVDQQIRLISDLKNQMDRTQPFAYLVLIQNSQNQAESLSWLTGNLTSSQKITSDVTWIPFKEGVYTATVFVWESIDNPTALSPPLSMEINVKNED
jgi:hypothetical protein